MDEKKKVKIFGKVTDFNGTPLSDAVVELKNDKFEDIQAVSTDQNGAYRLDVEKGLYYAFYACKDYKINYLEYWAWNVPVFDDLELNVRIDGLEVYAVNAFRIQGGYPSLSLFFRPMSLQKAKDLEALGAINIKDKLVSDSIAIIDICPVLSKEDMAISIDGQIVPVLTTNKILEYIGNAGEGKKIQQMYSYLVQVGLPDNYQNDIQAYKKINISLTDRKTGEKGEASLFWKE